MDKIPGNKTSFATRGGLGYVSLDDAMEQYYFQSIIGTLSESDEEQRQYRIELLEKVDEVADKYLNSKEKCIYHLVIHEHKRTSDITTILNYNGWRTTQNSIDRVFKILKLYYDFEIIDKEELEEQINNKFNKLEKRVIKLLESRFTIQQINNKLGKKFHYTKTHYLIKGIMERLLESGIECEQYHDFLVEIRKFKDSCNFDEKNDRVTYKE